MTTRSGRVLAGLAGGLLVITVVGLVVMWPAHRRGADASELPATLSASVAQVVVRPCGGGTGQRCESIVVRVGEGADRGRRSPITLGPTTSITPLHAGQAIRVTRVAPLPGAGPAQPAYGFAGVERRASMTWLLVAFAALVLVLARWRGLLSLVGFALSIVVITRFIVPAILAGTSPLLVALVGSLAVMWVTLGLTYGIAPASLAAALGIAASLGAAALLAHLWVDWAALDGRSTELGGFLAQRNAGLSLQGVVLAGMVIGALGVLADTGVTQASAVMALRRANPGLPAPRVYHEAFAIGRDHLTATIHTLVLAYVGASLPLILVLSGSGITTTDALNTQDIAEPVVATLVGSIALLASVPLTTGLSAMLAARIPAADLPHDGHHHH